MGTSMSETGADRVVVRANDGMGGGGRNLQFWQRRVEGGNPGRRARARRMTRKERGEIVEAAFLAVAAALGLRVAKPWGDSARYDFIVDNGTKLLRVQVKSAFGANEYGGYAIKAQGFSKAVYTSMEIDLLVAYLAPIDVWYVIPVEEFRERKAVKLYPKTKKRISRFEKFREAWWYAGVEME